MIRLTHGIARPEHSLVRSEKHDLFKILMGDNQGETTDELYVNSKRYIERVLNKNLEKI